MAESCWTNTQAVREWHGVDADKFRREIEPLNRPAVLRGVVAHWPAVAKAKQSPRVLADYLIQQCNADPVSAFVGDPAIRGRFFYGDDWQGMNFSQRREPLGKLLSFLLREIANPQAPAVYAGAVSVAQHAPALLPAHSLDLLPPSMPRQTNLWIGNRTRIAAHWDHQYNLACVIGGHRRYTLFPTHQIKNLYFGPLETTPAGVPISLVDFHQPDFAHFPRFREALAHAEIAELDPGDALYMPSLWVHHAESFDGLGVMMNFWWQPWPDLHLSPLLTILHSQLTVRSLPPAVRAGWRELFDLYVFATDDPLAHIPEHARGLLGAATPQRTLAIVAKLQQALEQLKAAIQERAAPRVIETKPRFPR